MRLKIGDEFIQTFSYNPIKFKVTGISENTDEVDVICSRDGYPDWEEHWNDLHCVYQSLNNGDYVLVEK